MEKSKKWLSRFLVVRGRKGADSPTGFTLVEMVVAVGLFAVVMVICVDVLLALVNANRKAQALQSVMNNLNIALDGMVRAVREGSTYDGSLLGCPGNSGGPKDCTTGTTKFSFEPHGNTSSDPPWVYTFAQDSNGIGRVYRSIDNNQPVPITAPEVSIDVMDFYVIGTDHGNGDVTQPRVIIVIEGSAGGTGGKTRTTFHIQATAVQRVLDL